MNCEAQYGGRITDDFDRRLFNTYGTAWLAARCGEVAQYCAYVFPANDSPEIFWLYTNADLSTILNTQPKDSSGSGRNTREVETVAEICGSQAGRLCGKGSAQQDS